MLDAIVIAGGIPQPDEPLYPYTQGQPKALLDVAGKPMVQWVLDALCGAQSINNVVMIGLEANSGVSCDKIRSYIPSEGGIFANVRSGVKEVLRLDPKAHHMAIVSADIPSILPEHIDWVVNTAMQSDVDLSYNMIRREVMEARFPGSKRTYIKFKDAAVCGGDLNVVRTMTVTSNDHLWEEIIEARKNALKQAMLIGIDTLFLLMFRMLTVDHAVKRIAQKMNMTGRALDCPYAEIGMDVDKPHQLELMRADLASRSGRG